MAICGRKCEVWARIVGYIRPLQQWNLGKKSEYQERKVFKVPDNEQLSTYNKES